MPLRERDTDNLTLVIDLDGTLVRTDTLFETFWAACAVNWTTPLAAVGSVIRGPLALKSSLASLGKIDASRLPYNEALLEQMRSWKKRGGRLALVTAALQPVADAVSKHLGLFDDVYGSGDGVNLKGRHKARFLNERYGSGSYIYVGDSRADLAVWKQSAVAVTVTPHEGLRKQVDSTGVHAVHMEAKAASWRDYLRALRPHQWLKNCLVFVPLLASHQFTPLAIGQSLLAFVAFCLIASSVYIFNDLLDLDADRAHPRKCNRPFASGAVPVRHGTIMAPLLGMVGLGVATLSGWSLLLIILSYYLVSFAYSLSLKRLVAIDIAILALLYTLRVLAGGAATDITPSVWLLGFSTFFFFMLACIKRQAELVDAEKTGTTKAHGRDYHVDDLSVVRSVAISSGLVSVLVLALYADSDQVKSLYQTPEVFWGICLILMFWNARIAILTQRGAMRDDPLLFAAKDYVSHFCLLAAAVLLLAGSLF